MCADTYANARRVSSPKSAPLIEKKGESMREKEKELLPWRQHPRPVKGVRWRVNGLRSHRVRIRPETLQVVHTVGDCRHASFSVRDYRVSNEFT